MELKDCSHSLIIVSQPPRGSLDKPTQTNATQMLKCVVSCGFPPSSLSYTVYCIVSKLNIVGDPLVMQLTNTNMFSHDGMYIHTSR